LIGFTMKIGVTIGHSRYYALGNSLYNFAKEIMQNYQLDLS
jgi:hypothetical protein